MIKRSVMSAMALTLVLSLGGCTNASQTARAIYFLIDVSGSYYRNLGDSIDAIKLTLPRLAPVDTIAAARIDECSFRDNAIILSQRLPERPSDASRAKVRLAQQLDRARRRIARSEFTDISGALYQAAQFLQNARTRNKTLVIFSDMEEDLPPACQRDASLQPDMSGIAVYAVNVTKLGSDNRNPSKYFKRLEDWEARMKEAGASSWEVVPNPQDVPGLFGAF